MRWIMRSLVRLVLGRRFTLRGAEAVPRRGPLLVCANHPATIDPPLVPAFLPRPDSWSMAKAEWFRRAGLKRWFFVSYQAFPVVRHSPDRRAIRQALAILGAGQALVVYPEGTRVETGGLLDGEPGAGFLARAGGAAVQPVALIGTRDCLPKGARWPRRVPVQMVCGPPLKIRERRPGGARVSNQEATDAIMLAIAEQLPPPMRGAYSDLAGLRVRLAGVWEPA